MDEKSKRLAFAMVEWLESTKSKSNFSTEEQESLDGVFPL
jgi:hypothetical protein